MSNFAIGMGIGLMYGFIIFFSSPHDKDELRKDGAIQVYEGRMKCEKAMNTWVCGQPETNKNGEQ